MFWFGLILVILGTAVSTMLFALGPNRNALEREGAFGLYTVCFAMIMWGTYVLYPVST